MAKNTGLTPDTDTSLHLTAPTIPPPYTIKTRSQVRQPTSLLNTACSVSIPLQRSRSGWVIHWTEFINVIREKCTDALVAADYPATLTNKTAADKQCCYGNKSLSRIAESTCQN